MADHRGVVLVVDVRAHRRSPCCRGHAALSLLLISATGCSSGSEGRTTPGTGGSSAALATGGTTSTGGSNAAADAAIDATTGTGGITPNGGAIGQGGTAGSVGPGGTTGGITGKGGAIGKGGTVSTGGTAGAGATSRDAGVPPSTGGEGGSLDGGSQAACAFEVTTELSPAIATVGIVTWSTSLANLKSARIDFGLTTDYGMTAPVDLQAPSYRTLLLGLKGEKTYHYRIVASDGAVECPSDDRTLTTGKLSLTLSQQITVSTESTSSPTFGGFLMTGQSYVTEISRSEGYILDADGELVWALTVAMSNVVSMRMSYAGTHMWFNHANVPSGTSRVHRTTMDGLTDEDLSSLFVGQHFRLTVLPDETVLFIAHGASGCDDIKEYSPDGTVRTVVNAGAAQGLQGECEVVDVQHSNDDDTVVFADYENRSLVKVRRQDGATLWVLNGSHATFTGDTWPGAPWGVHVLGPDRVLLFATNAKDHGGTGDGSSAIEMSLDLTSNTATQVWSYKASPAIQADVLADVQRMPGGNTIVAYSGKAVLHEIDASGTLLQEWSWGLGKSFGYIEKRATLYGPPQR